jgi:chromate reductase
MSQYEIGVLVGSLRKESFNRKLANAVIKLAPAGFSFRHLEIGDLPLYNQDDDANQHATVKRLRAAVTASHGLLFVTPEYNRSTSGVLKNAIDHASRPYGQNAWAGKPAGMMGASIGAAGTAMSQQHLRNILAYVDMPTLAQPEIFIQVNDKFFDPSGNIGSQSTLKLLQGWMDRFTAWVKNHAPG